MSKNPTGFLVDGFDVAVRPTRFTVNPWKATARPRIAAAFADRYTVDVIGEDPVTVVTEAVRAFVAKIQRAEPAPADRVPVNEDTVERLARAVADRVAEKLERPLTEVTQQPLTISEVARQGPPVEPKRRAKNGRRRRGARGRSR